jgi:glycerol kinase
VEKVFEPKMPRAHVDELRSRWNTALERAKGWEQHAPTSAKRKTSRKK